jgi:hypothetical protein
MQTASGGYLYLTDEGAQLTMDDIALGLSRQPRFGGQCRRHWTVLHHTLVTYYIAKRYFKHNQIGTPEQQNRRLLLVLMHDAHEAFLGDVPKTLKDSSRMALEHKVDITISKALGTPLPALNEVDFISWVDVEALQAEGRAVGPNPYKFAYYSHSAMDIVSTISMLYVDHKDDEAMRSVFRGLIKLHHEMPETAGRCLP